VSRRRQRAPDGAREAAQVDRPSAAVPGRPEPRPSFLPQAGILLAIFAVVSLIAELAGAANLGVALGVGQIAFAIALVVLMVKT
jgi:hypothetical protein